MKRWRRFAKGDARWSDTFKSCTRRMEKVEGIREMFLCGTGWGAAGRCLRAGRALGQQLTAPVASLANHPDRLLLRTSRNEDGCTL